jgi:uncharacterized protein (DUF58 family)
MAGAEHPTSAPPEPYSRGSPAPDHQRIDRHLGQLELAVLRRLDGILQGDHRGLVLGAGEELGESRLYAIGDDLRRMDWRLTARTARPHVRDTIADRELELWVVVDDSPSLRFGTDRYLKWDLAIGAVACVALLTARAGNRVGAVSFGGGPLRVFPPEVGREAARRLVARLDRSTRIGAPEEPASTLADALVRVRRLSRQRGMVAVVSDFLLDGNWPNVLRGLRDRHDLLAFEVLDPRELELPPVGIVTLVDPETGRAQHVQTSSRRVRRRYSEVADAQREETRAGLRRAGADHVVLRTDSDWVLEIARFVGRRRRLAQQGATSSMGSAHGAT